ncbi:MAG: aspartate--tRNA(Asn) ligase [Amoebophilaceae bacterium]|nr:aspartate--tRNA(Asn) ligase [Amoebophilaceae bacterium]
MQPLSTIQNLSTLNVHETIRLRGRVFSKKDCGKVLFLILRDGIDTLQTILVKNHTETATTPDSSSYLTLSKVENESYIEVIGKLNGVKNPIRACSQQWIELEITQYTIISRSVLDLPITLKEAALTEEEKNENPALPSIQFFKRLDNRVLDLRTNLSQAIFQLYDGLIFYTQKYLRKQGFLEIKTPKLIGGSSEGGADVFKVDYFGRTACLAQSPQLYKQMAIIGDFKRVFEIGPVFRAENSNSNRHLTEFIGIDFEMVIDKDYKEVIHLAYQLLSYLFDKLNRKYEREIAIVRSFFEVPSLVLSPELLTIEFKEAVSLLKKQGNLIGDFDDLTTENEKQLGAIIKATYNTDLYVVTQYPAKVRPFYTMGDAQDNRYTHSYDFMLRGEEILSGAQRIHDYKMLCQKVRDLGIDEQGMGHYLDGFKYGAPPHGGVGIGLERVLKYFLGLPNIRYCSLFPRDPKRLHP